MILYGIKIVDTKEGVDAARMFSSQMNQNHSLPNPVNGPTIAKVMYIDNEMANTVAVVRYSK